MTGACAATLATYAAAVRARDWPGLRDVLADDVRVSFLHTGEELAVEGYLAFMRDYPGDWDFVVDEVVDGGERAVLRSHTVIGGDTWHAASFATTDARGRLVELTEVWTEAVAAHPERSIR